MERQRRPTQERLGVKQQKYILVFNSNSCISREGCWFPVEPHKLDYASSILAPATIRRQEPKGSVEAALYSAV